MKTKFILLLFFICSATTLFSQSGWLWGRQATGPASTASTGHGLCTDKAGNIVVTGSFEGVSIIFGTTTLITSGYDDVYIAKYDASGNVLWAKSASGMYSDEGHSVSTDAEGNIYLTGRSYSPTITFGSITLNNSGGCDIFIVKYDTYGNVIWAKREGTSGDDEGNGISIDPTGNIFVTGYFSGTSISFGSTALTSTAYQNVFTTKYDANGNVLWAKSAAGLTGGTGAYGNFVSSDANGNALVTGFFSSPVNIVFGSSTLVNSGLFDVFVVKYDANGNELWAKSASGTKDDISYSISTDPAGNVFITGKFFSSTFSFGSITLTNTDPSGNSADIFTAKYDASGNELWAKSAGATTYDDISYSVSADTSGNAYITGRYHSPTIIFGSMTLTQAGNYLHDMFLVKYDANGNAICGETLPGGKDNRTAVSADRFGNAYATGFYDLSPFVVGPDTLTMTVGEIVFVSKYNCNIDAGINDGAMAFNPIHVFPNPSSGNFILEVENGSLANSEMIIYNVLGEKIISQKLISEKTEIDLSNNASGIYFVSVQTEKGLFTQKISIQK